MPATWTEKDERQYEHIKKSAKSHGTSSRRAKEIAARTVNKRRRTGGRTPMRTTQGTGNPNIPLTSRTRDELYNLATRHEIKGRSRMNKADLIRVLKKNGH